jgi:NADP-dependent 3-hydroxy acid dehydrogenase YdfG
LPLAVQRDVGHLALDRRLGVVRITEACSAPAKLILISIIKTAIKAPLPVIPADSVARAIAYAIEQPADVDVNEILLRPTVQEL